MDLVHILPSFCKWYYLAKLQQCHNQSIHTDSQDREHLHHFEIIYVALFVGHDFHPPS